MSITVIFIALLALVAFAYVAVPLIFPAISDPLPDDRDPVLVDMGEERDALFAAIAELDAREDLPAERRATLHDRYEAKAAQVITRMEARRAELGGAARGGETDAEAGPSTALPTRKKRAPAGALVVLGALVTIAALMPTYILPRVGQDSNVTTTDMDVAQRLQAEQRAAQREPTVANLMALGDTYLGLQQLDDAEATYLQAAQTGEPVPAAIYQRLAIIKLQSDLPEAHQWLNLAHDTDPSDLDTLFLLAEVSWVLDDLDGAEDAYTELAQRLDEPDEQVTRRLELIGELKQLEAAAADDPSEQNLLALADTLWGAGEGQRAVQVYYDVLMDHDPFQPTALARTGELLLASGRANDAAGLLERAAEASGGTANLEPTGARALADAYLQLGEWQEAADAYGAYIEIVGADAAGDASSLMAAALQRATGAGPGTEAGDAVTQLVGEQLFSSYCTQCHGPSGEGGLGPRLAGSPRAANRANVLDAVRFGRGMMPSFQAELSTEQIESVATYVAATLAR